VSLSCLPRDELQQLPILALSPLPQSLPVLSISLRRFLRCSASLSARFLRDDNALVAFSRPFVHSHGPPLAYDKDSGRAGRGQGVVHGSLRSLGINALLPLSSRQTMGENMTTCSVNGVVGDQGVGEGD
jgi:hypothetical protein